MKELLMAMTGSTSECKLNCRFLTADKPRAAPHRRIWLQRDHCRSTQAAISSRKNLSCGTKPHSPLTNKSNSTEKRLYQRLNKHSQQCDRSLKQDKGARLNSCKYLPN